MSHQENTHSIFKARKHVPVKGVDDTRQITVTFIVSAVGEFFYQCKSSMGEK